jgi:DNA modification methylase
MSDNKSEKWRYGDSWEKFPIEEGEVWIDEKSGSKVMVRDLREETPDFITNVDMIYMDPPWNQGNVNSFVTKAGLNTHISSFNGFMETLFNKIYAINAPVCYLEIGKQYLEEFKSRLNVKYPAIQEWEITYYKKHPMFLIRGGNGSTSADFTGMDDDDTPFAAIKTERPNTVLDFCTGRGTTMRASHANGARFYGTELNKRRLAVAIERALKYGACYKKL